MGAWLLVGALCIVAALVTVAALFSGGEVRRPGVRAPDWVLPTPVEMRAGRFPLTWRGYDPVHVDVYLDAVAGAYEALYVAAPPEVIAQARERRVLLGSAVHAEPASVTAAQQATEDTADEQPDEGSPGASSPEVS